MNLYGIEEDMKIETRPNVPKELRESVTPHLEARLWLLPDWCNKVVVGYDMHADWTAETHVYKQYCT